MMTALRQRRRAKRLHEAAAAVESGQEIGPSDACAICGRRLTDEVSIARAIGPVCWEHVMDELGHGSRPPPAMPSLQAELTL
jgi:Family of unknown function (DUF6011)